MKIPSLILKQLYTFSSLANTGDGVRFSLKNRLSDATLTRVLAVRLDGSEVPLERVRLDLGSGQVRTARSVSPTDAVSFPLRHVMHVDVADAQLARGNHEVQVAFDTSPFGEMTLKVNDSIADEPARRVTVPLDKENNYSREIVRKRPAALSMIMVFFAPLMVAMISARVSPLSSARCR